MPFSTDMERYNTLSGVRKLSFPEDFKQSYSAEVIAVNSFKNIFSNSSDFLRLFSCLSVRLDPINDLT